MRHLALLALLAVANCQESFKVIFQWNTIDVVWPSEEAREAALQKHQYIAANNPIAGIKLWKGRLYLTVPRWKEGVPVTLGVISATPQNRNHAPKLEAFPSWAMQKVGDCSAFQFVQSMEIDPMGRMWVLDTGRTETQTLTPKARCPPRLVILDLENNGEVLRSYNFPEDVTPADSSYLNDIVLDHEEGGLAYITDNGQRDPGIIVYSLANNTSWKIRHESMKAESEAVTFMVAKSHVINPVNVDGIALSPASSRERYVYYTPLSSFHLYALPTAVLRNRSNVDNHVRDLGRKNSQTDGMVMSAAGVLYFGLLADDAVAIWDTKGSISSFTNSQRVISRDHQLMQWPDTFAFDEDGYLWCVTNSLQNFLNNRVDVNVPNYRVIRIRIGSKNYQYYEDGSAPNLPIITAGASSLSMSTGLMLLLLCLAK